MKNGQIWYDDQGNTIQAHGGMILEHEGTYYWYGENKDAPVSEGKDGRPHLHFIGISCYSSKDLMNWHYEGLCLKASDDPNSDLYYDKIGERPKVLYNKKNNNFVLWWHIDTQDYEYAKQGVAISDRPEGPFVYQKTVHPLRSDSRDMTMFIDQDGKAYGIYSSDWNKTLRIAELNEDFTEYTGRYKEVMKNQSREAPAIIYWEGMYYMVTSGCTGWRPNSALYSISNDLMGEWRLIDNPCMGPDYRKTFYGQSTYIFTVKGQPYLMLDHWTPGAEKLKMSGYSILPMIIKDDYVEIPWQDEFIVE
jgi:hypothetical protein